MPGRTVSRFTPATRPSGTATFTATAAAVAWLTLATACAPGAAPRQAPPRDRPAAPPAPAALPAAPAESLGLDPDALARIDTALQALVDSARVPGVYAVIARHGRIGWERTFGWRDPATRDPLRRDDIFRIYSMTKPVVAAGILRLVDEGRVKLDDPVATYIPAFARVKVFAGGTADGPVLRAPTSPPTVRQLLNHTAGLAYGLTPTAVDTIFVRAKLYDADRTLSAFADSLATIPLLFDPGTSWSYGSGLDVAGRVIEVASGQTLDAFLERAIFRPLGMDDTGFRIRPGTRDRLVQVYRPAPGGGIEPLVEDGLLRMFEPDARFLWGSGGLLATPDDYLRFARMLQDGGVAPDGTRVLSPESVDAMTHNTLPDVLTPVPFRTLPDSAYGFGLGVAVRVATPDSAPPGPIGIYRWSGYLGTYFWVDPANDLVAMAWTQLSPGGAVPLQARFQELVYPAVRPGTSAR